MCHLVLTQVEQRAEEGCIAHRYLRQLVTNILQAPLATAALHRAVNRFVLEGYSAASAALGGWHAPRRSALNS